LKILIQKKALLVSLIVTTLPLFITDSYGHGIGYEVFPPVQLGDKRVALEVTSSQYQDPGNSDREISFALFDTESGILLEM